MPPIRVLVVDDSVVVRRMITEALATDPGLEVVGIAANGRIALQKVTQVNPDVVTLDIEMPELDGVATVRELRKTHPRLPIIMCSALTVAGAEATLDALAAGANDYVTKPTQSASVADGIARLAADLVPRIRALCHAEAAPVARVVPPPDAARVVARPGAARSPFHRAPEVLCLASSTGGPNALADVFAGFTEALPVPVVLVQHMPPVFTKSLADRLGRTGPHPFHEATDGQALEPGNVYVAPGGRHMEVERSGTRLVARLHDGPPENSCRPAADVLFRSVAKTFGGASVACVLTGMGQDGMRGCGAVVEAGGYVIAQDEPTSVVWGMPGAIAQAGLCHKVLPLPLLAGATLDVLKGGRA